MNERQRDLFLYEWSKRRGLGQIGAGLRGAAIGALGGVAFALIMMGGSTSVGAVLPLSVPAFALLGFVLANRVFASQEAMYQSIVATGAQPPAENPAMQGADRWPAIAVGVAVAIIVGFILVVATMYG